MLIKCPSGLIGEARRLKAKELRMLQELAGSDSVDGGVGEVLNSCWERTVDPGVYKFIQVGDTKIDWSRVFKGDLVSTLFALRTGTLGPEYEFDIKCNHCDVTYGWTIDLLKDLQTKELSQPVKDALMQSDYLQCKLPVSGAVAKFKIPSAQDDVPMNKLIKQLHRSQVTVVDKVAAQLITADGMTSSDIRSRWAWVDDLDLEDLYALRDACESADCGIDTGIRTRCTRCKWEQQVELPLTGTFFDPSKGKKKTIPAITGLEGGTA